MTLLVFSTNGNTWFEKERLNSSVNWNETSLINNLRIFVGIELGSKAFKGLRNIITFSCPTSSVGSKKKEFILVG